LVKPSCNNKNVNCGVVDLGARVLMRAKLFGKQFWEYFLEAKYLPLDRGNGTVLTLGSGREPTFFCFIAPPRLHSLGLGLDTKNLGKQVQLIAEPIARALDLDLLDISCQGKGAGSVVLITLDKNGGVGIRDCEQFHQSLRRALEVAESVPFAYRLEVSSPGVDRPLKNLKDYQRLVGKVIQVKIQDPEGEQQQVIGRLSALTESGVTLLVRTGKQQKTHEVELLWDSITEAKQQVEF